MGQNGISYSPICLLKFRWQASIENQSNRYLGRTGGRAAASCVVARSLVDFATFARGSTENDGGPPLAHLKHPTCAGRRPVPAAHRKRRSGAPKARS
jgi:hypothetical protein